MTTKNGEPLDSHPDACEPSLSIYNAPALAKLYKLLIESGQVVELRAIGVQFSSGRPHIEAGFFDSNHLLPMAKEALRLSKVAKGVYFTLNPLHHDLLARRCNRVAWAAEGELAKDKNVLARRWLLVDVDPVRDALISATDAEKEHAWDTVQAVREFLGSNGWPAPLLADSGNGFHLLYRIDLPGDDGGLVRRVLQALAHRFDSAAAKIDQAVFNPARICKLPGTLARKGDHTPQRPHRLAKLLEIRDDPTHISIEVVTHQLLEELAATAPPPAAASGMSPPIGQSTANGAYTSRLLIDKWLTDRGVSFRVKPQSDGNGRVVYVLAQCPFDSSHGDPDACIMQDANGKLSAHCFHNGCAGRGWQQFKEAIGAPSTKHYDPPLSNHSRRRCNSSRKTPARIHGKLAEPSSDGTEPSAASSDENVQKLITIQGNQRQLRDVTADALAAVLAHNNPPKLFQRGGLLTRLRMNADGCAPQLEPLSDPALRGVLARSAN
jgi:hypothetical protein